jgi:fructose 1,6-bisphosphatase
MSCITINNAFFLYYFLEETIMKMKPITLVVAGIAAATLLSAPSFAAKVSMSDTALDGVTGMANNDYTFSSDSTATLNLSSDASANIQFDWYQWTDDHSADTSSNKGANDQSCSASQVQQSITGSANALIWGSAGQNVLTNTTATTINGVGNDQVNMSYGVFAAGGF